MKLHKNPQFIYRYHCIGFYQQYPTAISLPCHIFNRYQRKIELKEKTKTESIYISRRETRTRKPRRRVAQRGWKVDGSRVCPGMIPAVSIYTGQGTSAATCWLAVHSGFSLLCIVRCYTVYYGRQAGQLGATGNACIAARVYSIHIYSIHTQQAKADRRRVKLKLGQRLEESRSTQNAMIKLGRRQTRGVLLWGCVLLTENPLHLRTRRFRLIDGLFYVEESIMRSFSEMME